MFVRYSLTADAATLARRFGIDVPESYQPRFNAAPTHLLPLITDEGPAGLSYFYWGSPPEFANQKPLAEKLINAKSEQFPDKSVLRKRLRERRCIIPADGFFVWKKYTGKSRVPTRVTLADKSLFAMAGLWEEYEDTSGEMNHTFLIVTTEAPESAHLPGERIPLILQPDDEKKWLMGGPEEVLIAKMKPYSGALESYAVSALVNQIDRNDASIIRPAPAADQFGNYSLFGQD